MARKSPPLFRNQTEMFKAIKGYLGKKARRKIRRILLSAACSSGKGRIALEMGRLFLKQGKRVLYITFSKTELREQAVKSNTEFHKVISEDDVCVIRPGEAIHKERPFFIGIPQTIRNRDIGTFDLIIIDECHAYLDGENKDLENIISRVSNKNAVTLGMTGTGFDICGPGKYFDITREDTVRIIYDMPAAIADGVASNLDVYIDYFRFELKHELYNGEDLNAAGRLYMKNKVINALKLQAILARLNDDKKYLIIVPPGTALDICNHINAHVKTGCAVVKISTNKKACKDPDAVDLQFRKNRKIKFMVVVYMAGTGWDFPELEGVVDLTFTKNPQSIIQRLSRSVRPHPDKKDPVYIYCCDQSKSELQAKTYISRALALTTTAGIQNYTGIGEDTIIVSAQAAGAVLKFAREGQNGIPLSEFTNFITGKDAADKEVSIRMGSLSEYYNLLSQDVDHRTILKVPLSVALSFHTQSVLRPLSDAIMHIMENSYHSDPHVNYSDQRVPEFFEKWWNDKKRVLTQEEQVDMAEKFAAKFPESWEAANPHVPTTMIKLLAGVEK